MGPRVGGLFGFKFSSRPHPRKFGEKRFLAVRRSWRGNGVALFWATSLEKIFGGGLAIISFRPRGWVQQSAVPRCAIRAREASGSETPRVHHAARRRGGVAARGAHAAMACRSTGNAMKGIAEWLSSIGLSEYAQRFADNAIDLSVIRDLTEQDLKDLGVLLGHRRKILRT